ncbi:MAG: DNA cytosine methyltransferase [Anaerobutyricum hallii]|uniref:DNA cytosine methyltransferase n=1 Tax=Anaerobutyricum hallii TaxID=39488 RepID=UPI002A80E4F6|nr:DNA cytosine methyltransferase [Anaerobutyricum hallii]MDY4577983.1 DNA cytosine methyltransferase [Anaerobutyricum hallii]
MDNKTFSMIELFSGIGAQERALRQLKIPYRIINTCDCDKDAVLSYAAMRFDIDKATKEYQFPTQDKMIEELQNKGFGYDFMKGKHTITSRTPINKLKKYYIADKLSNNLGDISKVERLPYADIVTYSFPCTDLSVAGRGEGMVNKCSCGYSWPIDFSNNSESLICPSCGAKVQSSTRSGLLGKVQRLLAVSKKENTLPKYLLLENVKNLVGKKFKPQFDAWIRWLDSIGYNTYYQVLNSKNFGIPQNRERIFALSIRKDVDNGNFKFPEQIPLTTRLKDILEKTVDEKYYLSGDKVESILANFIARQNEASGINLKDQATTFDGITDVAHTLMARDYKGFGNQSMTGVIEPIIVASRGRNPENPSDRTTGSPTEQRLEANMNGTTNTITTVAKDNYVMEPVVCEPLCDEGLRFFKDDIVGTLRTIDACCDKRVIEPEDINPVRIGNIYGEQFGTGYAGNVWDQDSVSPTIMTAQGGNRQPLVVDNVKWRIRKLTPKECWRLMGFSDKDCNHASKYVSNSALYKQAGNSIVTSCLVAIFYSLLFKDSSTKWSDYIVQYKINGGGDNIG